MVQTREQKQRTIMLRSFIHQEVLNGEKIEKAYENFSEKNGEDAMEYLEFDFWYYRFYNGNYDLDYNRDLEPKNRTFTDLPIEVVDKLVDRVDPIDRLVLRRVSHFLQDVINDKNIICDILLLSVQDDTAKLSLGSNQHSIVFESVEGGCEVKYGVGKELIRGGNHLKMVINEFLLILKQPKLKLWSMIFGFHASIETEEEKNVAKKFLNFLESELQTLNHLVHVEHVSFIQAHLESALSVLPYVKPGSLRSIKLQCNSCQENQLIMDKIFELDQWKQAVKTEGVVYQEELPTSMERVFQFTHFKGELPSITNEDLIKIRDVLLAPSIFHFYDFALEKPIDKEEVANIFNAVLDVNSSFIYRDPRTYQIVYHFRIRNDNLGMVITTELVE